MAGRKASEPNAITAAVVMARGTEGGNALRCGWPAWAMPVATSSCRRELRWCFMLYVDPVGQVAVVGLPLAVGLVFLFPIEGLAKKDWQKRTRFN